jgi:CheY-like chemotaxis protein
MTRAPHILIVDDDPKIRNGLSKFLTGQGLRTTTASDGRDMQAKLATAQIDLIILDVMMPGEDGLSLCRKLSAGRRDGSHHRSGNRCRRLCLQAFQPTRVAGPYTRRSAPQGS